MRAGYRASYSAGMSAAVVRQRLARVPAWLVDALVAVLVAGWVVYRMASGSGPADTAPDALGYGLALSMAAALLVRRRWPLAVLLWMFPTWFVYHVNGYVDGAPGPAVWVALYSGAAAERRRGVFLAAAALLVCDAFGRMEADGAGLLDTAMDSSTVIWIAALLLGDAVRSRRRWLAETHARLRQAEADQEREAERRVADERLRIARELHDVLAHTIGVVTVQSGVAADTLERRPAAARSALAAIRTASREAMDELRATIGVLRRPEAEGTPDGGTPPAPAPGLGQLDDLVGTAAGAGLRVELAVDGEPRPLPAAVGLTAYRIVQEALANVARHARAAIVVVSVCYEPDAVRIEVSDDGRGPTRPPADGQVGYGLLGMRERAEAVGGWLEAGPGPDGGFRVRACLPTRQVKP
jgi:signal transduction histidine kinase